MLALLGLVLSQLTTNSLNQMTDVSLAIAGLTLAVVGTGLFVQHSLTRFLRFWLLRMIFEQQSRGD